MSKYDMTRDSFGPRKPSTCDRCASYTLSISMSYFNTEWICPTCEDRERAHPDFERAREAELAACRRGNFNYPGIGKPSDL